MIDRQRRDHLTGDDQRDSGADSQSRGQECDGEDVEGDDESAEIAPPRRSAKRRGRWKDPPATNRLTVVAKPATTKRVIAAKGTFPSIDLLSAALAAACTGIRAPATKARSHSNEVVFMG